MNRNSLIAVLVGIVLGAIVAPGASSASGSYTAGHFKTAWPELESAAVVIDAERIATPSTG